MAILITAAAHSLAYRLEQILNITDVFLGDQNDLPAIPGKKFLRIPPASSTSFSHEILSACLDHNISEIYPLHRDEIIELSKSRQLFEEYGISLIIASDEWLKNNSTISSFITSNLAVLKDGVIKAGNLSVTAAFPGEKASGVYTWIVLDNVMKYNLFVVEDVEV